MVPFAIEYFIELVKDGITSGIWKRRSDGHADKAGHESNDESEEFHTVKINDLFPFRC